MSKRGGMWNEGFRGLGGWWGSGSELWILTIWPRRKGGERMICLTGDFNKDVAREGRVRDHRLNYSKRDWTIVWRDGSVIHSWGRPNCSFIFLYSPLLEPEGAWEMINKMDPRQPFPLNLVPIHLFSLLSLWCKCSDPAWLTVPSMLRPQKIAWNNKTGSEYNWGPKCLF